MLFKYKVTTPEGQVQEGDLDAPNFELALGALQKRKLIVVSLDPVKKKNVFSGEIALFQRVKNEEVVIFSRQISTLFEAKVPVLTSFELLASQVKGVAFKKVLTQVVDDIKGGLNISQSLAKHPKVFSSFYVNMIKSGEESGKLEEVFEYLAGYLERSQELASKAKRALIYPAFVIFAFIVVMILMLTVVIPQLTSLIKESNQPIPVYTKAVILVSDILRGYGAFVMIIVVAGVAVLWRYTRTKAGKMMVARAQLSLPYVGDLYKCLYLSRITDNMQTLISGGVSMIRSLEITSDVIENHIYKSILNETIEAVKGGANISDTFSRFDEVPSLASQMIKIGEETGKLEFILGTLSGFYRKEVDHAIETLVSMIEPLMTIVLGLSIGFLMASVLMPIYNIAMSV